MYFKYSLIACVIGFFLDIIIGDPHWFYHPIRLVGKLIEKSEKLLRKIFYKNDKELFIGGIFLVVIVCFTTVLVTGVIIIGGYRINKYLGLCFESLICYFFLATKALKDESMKVYYKLKEGSLEESRKAVSMIVGRDTNSLDEEGVTKAAVETVAENLTDAVLAPLLYMIVGGGILASFYKAVNTMDSMVGYKNEKYLYFGRFAAKLDDVLNFIPSRISAVMLIISSFLLSKNAKNAIKIFKRDRFNHASPNSAQTEAACAGALEIRLAGNAYYFGKLYEKPYIGDKIKEVKAENIVDANRLMYLSAFLTLFLFAFFKLALILILF